MPINSKAKGKRGELELAKVLRFYGYDARRSVQYCGSNNDADVIGLPHISIECKRVEKLNLYDAISQSACNARIDEKPVVMHRKNDEKWLCTMYLSDWIELYREWEAGQCLSQNRTNAEPI